MAISNEHNLNAPLPQHRPFGIRVSLPASDPLADVIGSDWHKEHWYATARERDRAMADMASRHPTFRIGDDPSLVLEKIERDGAAR